MAIIVKKFNINTGDRIYSPGEAIIGLDEQHEKQLVDDGYCEYASGTVALSETVAIPPTVTTPLSIEQFTELKAVEQNDVLESIGIDPGTNKEQRIQQYTEWYLHQENDGNGTGAEEQGPNTGMTI